MKSLAALDFNSLCGPVLEGAGSLCSWVWMIFVDNGGVVNVRNLGVTVRMQREKGCPCFCVVCLCALLFSPILAPLMSCLALLINLDHLVYLVAITTAFSFSILVDS